MTGRALDARGASFRDASTWRLDPSTLDLWWVELRGAGAEDWSILTEAEVARRRRLVLEVKRERKVAGRAALRRVLSLYVGCAPQDVVLEEEKHGRPRLVGEGPAFNLSDSGPFALVAVLGRGDLLGVDIEVHEARRRHKALAERFFSAREAEQWRALGADDRVPAFYRLWCRKEAYLKAWGTGLTFSSRRFSAELEVGRHPWLFDSEMPGEEDLSQWSVADLMPVAGVSGALCWREGGETLRFFRHGDSS